MAGSERKGVAYARADLFSGATCVVTPTRHTPDELTARVERLWAALGMRTVRMSPSAHDRAVARVSHLPHVLASLLMMLPQTGDLDVAATGFRDATRLAGGDPEMWRDILTTNRRAILDALDRFASDLSDLQGLLADGDAGDIEQFLAKAKRRRDETLAQSTPERRVAME
jgi:prephenate dehydrogenase